LEYGNAAVNFAIAFVVSGLAGKKVSIVTSDSVTSTAAPNTVVVLMKESGPLLASVSGPTIPPSAIEPKGVESACGGKTEAA
jgi:hypothetical protein